MHCQIFKGYIQNWDAFHPKKNEAFKVYADANFAGNWFKEYAEFDPAAAKSRSGWVITYANCTILWASKMQSQVALSTTEAEYISLSSALQDVIPPMDLAKALWDKFIFDIFC